MKTLLNFHEITYFTKKDPTYLKNTWKVLFLFSLTRNQLRFLVAVIQSNLAVVSKKVIFEGDLTKLKQAGTKDNPPEVPAKQVVWSGCCHVATCSLNSLYLCIIHLRLSSKVEEPR